LRSKLELSAGSDLGHGDIKPRLTQNGGKIGLDVAARDHLCGAQAHEYVRRPQPFLEKTTAF